MVAAAMSDSDWLDSGWDLSSTGQHGIPELPKSMTNARTAKKRRHKEMYVTEEQLDKPVRLRPETDISEPAAPRRKAGSKQAQQQEAAAAAAASADGDASAPQQPTKKHKKRSKIKEGDNAGADEPGPSASNTWREQLLKPLAAEGAEQAGDGGEAGAAAAADASMNKKKRNKEDKAKKQQGEGEGNQAASSAPGTSGGAGAAAAGEAVMVGAVQPAKPKKSKNKFKQTVEQEGAAGLGPGSTAQAAAGGAPQQLSKQPGAQLPSKQAQTPKEQRQLQQPKKKQQQQQPKQKQQPQPAAAAAIKPPAASKGSSGLLDRMRARLAGGHFRQLNEQLYTSPGEEAFSLMQGQPQLFTAYHEGFQSQTQGWPVKPVDLAARWLAGHPAAWKVADFGCGDAQLAGDVKQEVASLDLVAHRPNVIACNMADTPLATASQDAAVFSLALMGTDYGAFLVEAARVLKPQGWLWLAEVRSRFADGAGGKEDFGPFLACLKQLGFKLVDQDASNRMFVVMVLRKKGNAPAALSPAPAAALPWPALRACVYKKR